VKVWERPFVQLFAIFLLLGLLAFWTFQTVSLPPVLRDLFEEDSAVAAAALPPTEEERFQQELSRLPAPPENHAPEVAALLERLRKLPPVPYLVQAARQRDAAVPQGEAAPPWSAEELAALEQMSADFQQAWEPFVESPPIPWDRYPDSSRLFRSQISELKDMPPGYNFSSYFLLNPNLNLHKPLRRLGALRFGTDFLLSNGWAGLDTVSLAVITRLFFIEQAAFTDGSSAAPSPPQIEDLRWGLRSDRSLFLSSSRYLEALPPDTPASVALQRFLGNQDQAEWFLRRVPLIKTSAELARHLRIDAEQILSLENRTYLAAPAWRQWLENSASGLSPTLRDSLEGLRGFEQTRLGYQVSVALSEAVGKIQAGDVPGAKQMVDPAQPGTFLQVQETEGKFTVSSVLPSSDDPQARTSMVFPPPEPTSSASPTAGKTSPDAQGR